MSYHPNVSSPSWGSITGDVSTQTDLQTKLNEKATAVSFEKITVSATPPENPSINDLWIDIS